MSYAPHYHPPSPTQYTIKPVVTCQESQKYSPYATTSGGGKPDIIELGTYAK